MELLGFYYEKAEEKIAANGYPISRELLNQGYVQKNNSEGIPRWYVKPSKVWLILGINGVRKNFNIYDNIMAIYPERQRMTLQLAQLVVKQIIEGKIELSIIDGKPFLTKKESAKSKKK